MKKENTGSSLDDWLREEGTYEKVTAVAIKRVLARQIAQEMANQNLSKSEMASACTPAAQPSIGSSTHPATP
jgi:hypothetical protein